MPWMVKTASQLEWGGMGKGGPDKGMERSVNALTEEGWELRHIAPTDKKLSDTLYWFWRD